MSQILKSLQVRSRHLHIPVKNGNPKHTLQIWVEGRPAREFNVELATSPESQDGGVDWWAFYDISEFFGQTAVVQMVEEVLPEAVVHWLASAIQQSDGLIGDEDLYHERYRPQFHFTARRGWNNDPNGMVYHQAEWHLFYQHNPFGTGWGNMHWGHAVSPDLVTWRELPEALYQKSLADMAYSGSAVVDHANTAGFQPGAEAPLVVAFTSTGRGECLAYSLDRGRTFQEYRRNPILEHTGRDPKIIWHEPDRQWVMIVYDELAGPGTPPGKGENQESIGYAIYTSLDLKHWARQDFIPGFFECPELFELPVADQPGEKAWVMYGNLAGQFRSAFVAGSFNGKKFIPAMETAQAHYGPHFYAAQVFNHAPGGRVIMMGWLSGPPYPGMPFSQGMTVPLELSLRRFSSGLRLCFYPVEELSRLRTGHTSGRELDLASANRLLANVPGELLDIELTLRPAGQAPVRLSIGEEAIIYDPSHHELTFAGQTARLDPVPGDLALRILVDRSVVEVFANQGEAAFSAITLFPAGKPSLLLDGSLTLPSLTLHALRSIWDE